MIATVDDEPMAFLLFMPPGHEYDYMVFATAEQAHMEAARQDEWHDGWEPEIVPLYRVEKR